MMDRGQHSDKGNSKKPRSYKKIRPLKYLVLSLRGTYAWGEGKKKRENRTEKEVKGGTSGLGKGKIGKREITKERQLGDTQIGLRNRSGRWKGMNHGPKPSESCTPGLALAHYGGPEDPKRGTEEPPQEVLRRNTRG